jgi:hypothetical protein
MAWPDVGRRDVYLHSGSGVRTMNIEEAIKLTEYKYFGSYEFTPEQHEAVDVLVAAAKRLAEYEEAHRITVNDCGAPDEQHCSCVPSLRLEAKRLQARLAETQRILAIWASEYNLPDNHYDPKGLVMATRNVLRSTDSAVAATEGK